MPRETMPMEGSQLDKADEQHTFCEIDSILYSSRWLGKELKEDIVG